MELYPRLQFLYSQHGQLDDVMRVLDESLATAQPVIEGVFTVAIDALAAADRCDDALQVCWCVRRMH